MENLLSIVKSSPVPRVDISIYIAIAEILCRIDYRVPEAQITQKIGNPEPKNLVTRGRRWKYRMRQLYDISEQQVQERRMISGFNKNVQFSDRIHEELVFR